MFLPGCLNSPALGEILFFFIHIPLYWMVARWLGAWRWLSEGWGLIHLDLAVELMGLWLWRASACMDWCRHKDDAHGQNHKPLPEHVGQGFPSGLVLGYAASGSVIFYVDMPTRHQQHLSGPKNESSACPGGINSTNKTFMAPVQYIIH